MSQTIDVIVSVDDAAGVEVLQRRVDLLGQPWRFLSGEHLRQHLPQRRQLPFDAPLDRLEHLIELDLGCREIPAVEHVAQAKRLLRGQSEVRACLVLSNQGSVLSLVEK